jgi:hypothetical protein
LYRHCYASLQCHLWYMRTKCCKEETLCSRLFICFRKMKKIQLLKVGDNMKSITRINYIELDIFNLLQDNINLYKKKN